MSPEMFCKIDRILHLRYMLPSRRSSLGHPNPGAGSLSLSSHLAVEAIEQQGNTIGSKENGKSMVRPPHSWLMAYRRPISFPALARPSLPLGSKGSRRIALQTSHTHGGAVPPLGGFVKPMIHPDATPSAVFMPGIYPSSRRASPLPLECGVKQTSVSTAYPKASLPDHRNQLPTPRE